MPKRGVQDVVHTTYTDHRIQRKAGDEPRSRSFDLRAWRPAPDVYTERNAALAWFERAVATRDPAVVQRASRLVSELAPSTNDAALLAAKGIVALQENNPSRAVEWFIKGIALEPRSAEAYLRLGRAEQAAGRLDNANRSYEEALRLDPLFFEAYVLSAQLHRSRGDLQAYREVLQRYLRRVPSSLAARQALRAVQQ